MTSLQTLPQVPAQASANGLMMPFSEPWLSALRGAVGTVDGKPVLMSGFQVGPKQLAQIRRLISDLTNSLVPATDEQRAEELAKLFAAFPAPSQSEAPVALRMDAYFDAIEEAPAWALSRARKRFIRGETEFDTRFAPTPAQFALIVRMIIGYVRSDLLALQRIQEAASTPA